MPACTTPELWPVCRDATRSAPSSTTTRNPGRRRCISRAHASPRMPAPTTARSHRSGAPAEVSVSQLTALDRLRRTRSWALTALRFDSSGDGGGPAGGSRPYRMSTVRILVTGISGYVGSALAPRLVAAGHDVRGFARDARRVTAGADRSAPSRIPMVEGDAVTGRGLDEALEGVEV